MPKNSPPPQKHVSDSSVKLPVLVEVVFTLSKLTVVLVGIIVMVATFASGSPWYAAMFKGAVTVLSLGILVYVISWMITKGVIESARSMLKDADEKEMRSKGNTMDTNA